MNTKQMQTRQKTHQLEPQQRTALSILEQPGQALDAQTRAILEPRFGHSFADVRVHHDASATTALDSRAFAVGQDIVLGNVDTATPQGLEILTHELVHTVQNARHGPASQMKLSDVGDAAERSAQQATHSVFRGAGNAATIASSAAPSSAISLWNLGWTPEETRGRSEERRVGKEC